jgi:4-azaleucine resistance transporter AzlC
MRPAKYYFFLFHFHPWKGEWFLGRETLTSPYNSRQPNISASYSGFRQALPIILGYLPIGFAYGVLAQESGLATAEIILMSLVVYAGSSQFIAVSLLGMGTPPVTIILTTFLVNLRHLLLSASLVPYLRHFGRPLLAFISYQLTDETFAVASTHYSQHRAQAGYQLALNITAQTAWIFSSYLGAVLGNLIPDPAALGLNFALPAMFMALLVMQNHNRLTILVATVGGLLSLLVTLILPGNWNIILAAVTAASLGVIMEKWMAK